MNDQVAKKWRRRDRGERMRGRVRRGAEILGVLVFAVVVFNSLSSHGTKRSTPTTVSTIPADPPARADVTLSRCRWGNDAATALITITNHTHEQQNYVVHVLYADGYRLFAGTVVSQDRLDPGHRASQLAIGLSVSANPKNLHCAVSLVRRFP